MPCSSSSHCCSVNSQSSAKKPGHTRYGGSWAPQVHSWRFLRLWRSRDPGPHQYFSVLSSALVPATNCLQDPSATQWSSPKQWVSNTSQVQVLTQKPKHSHYNQPNCSCWDWNPKARPRKDLPFLGTLQCGCEGRPGSNPLCCLNQSRVFVWLFGLQQSLHSRVLWWRRMAPNLSCWSCLTLYTWLNIHWTKGEVW